MKLLPELSHANEHTSYSVRNPAPGLLIGRVLGRPSLEDGQRLLDYEEEMLEQHPDGLWIFHDWVEATGYAPGVRDLLVGWNRAHEQHLYRVEMVFKSRMVSMAVAVASIASPYMYVVHSLEDLESRIDRAIKIRNQS